MKTVKISGIPDDRYHVIKRIAEILEDYACADIETAFVVDMKFRAGEQSQAKHLKWQKDDGYDERNNDDRSISEILDELFKPLSEYEEVEEA